MARLDRRWILAALAVLAALTSGCGGEPAQEPTPARPAVAYDAARFDAMEPGVLRAYLQAQDALAHDRFEPAHAALVVLVEHTDGDLRPLAEAAAAAPDIGSARRAFQPLSEHLITTRLPEGYGVVYCPMAFDYAGAPWVQAEGDIMNPYYGAAMLHCGVFDVGDEE